MLRALALFLPLLLTGCFIGRNAENEPIAPEVLDQLQPGQTTAADVVALLGAPSDVVQLGKRSAYLYLHTMEKNAGLLLVVVGLFNEDRRTDRVWAFFDENQILTHVGATLAAGRSRYAMPWNSLHEATESNEQ